MESPLPFLTIACLIGVAPIIHAQDSITPRSRSLVQRASTVQAQYKPQSIAFRLTEWQSLRFDSASEAQQQVNKLEQLGCEAQANQHARYVDIAFSCAAWHSLFFETHDEAHAIQNWLTEQGFETRHNH